LTDLLPRLAAALADRFRVERELGAGGMATVYLAEDLKHARKVAIKVLRPELAAVIGAERFVQEIRTIATLQHPHILGLIDSGEVNGTAYYVMPFIEGESLRDRLTREKQLPIADAVRIATEVASALDYAHRHGVIHRDIKPENILLHEGQALVADFGIALAVSRVGGTRLTETGLSLGTPNYMSPEQAMGERTLDARTDVYSLGCVAYEMLTGEPPFTGPTAQAIIAKVMTSEPARLTLGRRTVPPAVEAAVLAALEKLPADRFATAAEFAAALEGGRTEGRKDGTRAPISGVPPSRPSARPVLGLLAAVAAATALALWGWLRPAPAEPVTRAQVILEGLSAYAPSADFKPYLSPDGSRIVYLENTGVVLLEQDQLHPVPIPGLKAMWGASFAPDGGTIAFGSGFPGGLELLSLADRRLSTLLPDSVSGMGTAWSDDGWIYYAVGNGVGLNRIRPTGGNPEIVVRFDSTRDALMLAYPTVLPGNKVLLATVWRRKSPPDIVAIDLRKKSLQVVTPGLMAFYASTGHLVFVEGDGSLMAARFDRDHLRLTGRPVKLAEGIVVEAATPQIGLSRNGTLLYMVNQPRDQIEVVDREGRERPVDSAWTGIFTNPAISPTGDRLAVSVLNGGALELWVKQLDRGPFTRVASGGTTSFNPSWTEDGRSILFATDQWGGRDILGRVPADGGLPPEVELRPARGVDEGILSRDQRWLIYRTGSGGQRDLYAMRPGVDSLPGLPVAVTDAEETSPALSPDGRWLAYVSDESGRSEVYVRPFPQVSAARQQVSQEGGTEPVWANIGRELFYRDAAGSLVSAQCGAGTSFEVTARRVLFDASGYRAVPFHQNYAVAPNGREFYFIRPLPGPAPTAVLVRNWFQELKTVGSE